MVPKILRQEIVRADHNDESMLICALLRLISEIYDLHAIFIYTILKGKVLNSQHST